MLNYLQQKLVEDFHVLQLRNLQQPLWTCRIFERKYSYCENSESEDYIIISAKTESRKKVSLQDKLQLQRKAKKLEEKRNEMRKKLFEAQDDIDNKKDILLDDVEKSLKQIVNERELFFVRWRLL